MKTLTKTLLSAMLMLFVLATTAMTTLASTFSFNKITITGKVKIELVQADREKIEVYGDYSSRNTSIKRQGYTLIIKSSEYEPVTIRISVADLQRIDASGDVTVETIGKFNLKYLQIFLKDNAKANVKATTESMYTFIKGHSDLKLSGATLDHTLVRDSISKLTIEHFVAVKTTNNSIDEAMAFSLNAK
ncbi:GIN domain-containing protein [Pedobacter frigoris]|uniref:Putative auto-transporter adhesin head GIN domain-containing protein n=1 Tax=Pedobacter frigoris TaxID=2571272 RepID=A0A4U1CEW9_9SPHI|nr:DUF2807 domain-containing protein [Pedobacter frigoris]TKC05101.1 hypothetical protein FA047_15160 [Pedobacter frigoris]